MKVYEHFGLKDNYARDKRLPLVKYPHRFVGYEAERESIHTDTKELQSFLTNISIKEDGSLREGGLEFIFNGPLRGNSIVDALLELFNMWRRFGYPSHSSRTSDHIHIDVTDFGEEALNTLYKNCFLLENTLYNFGSSTFNRKTNAYCLPHYQLLVTCPNKFSGFQLFSLPKYLSFRFSQEYGTIEFRMFESSNSLIEVLNRINISLEIVESSLSGLELGNKITRKSLKEFLPNTYQILESYLVQPNKDSLNMLRVVRSFNVSEYYTTNSLSGRYSASLEKLTQRAIKCVESSL